MSIASPVRGLRPRTAARVLVLTERAEPSDRNGFVPCKGIVDGGGHGSDHPVGLGPSEGEVRGEVRGELGLVQVCVSLLRCGRVPGRRAATHFHGAVSGADGQRARAAAAGIWCGRGGVDASVVSRGTRPVPVRGEANMPAAIGTGCDSHPPLRPSAVSRRMASKRRTGARSESVTARSSTGWPR